MQWIGRCPFERRAMPLRDAKRISVPPKAHRRSAILYIYIPPDLNILFTFY